MAELPTSPLPRDPRYWEELARRIRDDGSAPLAAYAALHESWSGVLARRAPWLLAASAAVMFLLWLSQPVSRSSVALSWMERSLAPSETAGLLIAGPEPPSVDALLAQFPPPPFEDGKEQER